jgi:hypothetical protein
MSSTTEPPGGQAPQRRTGWQLPGAPGSVPGGAPGGAPGPPQRQDRAGGRPDHGDRSKPRSAERPSAVLTGGIAGEARNIQLGTIQGSNSSIIVLTFRLEQHDPSAGRTSMVTVRMYGGSAVGFVSEGDWVEAKGQSRRGFLNAEVALNRTSGAEFRTKSKVGRRVGHTLFYIAFTLIVLTILLFFVSSFLG